MNYVLMLFVLLAVWFSSCAVHAFVTSAGRSGVGKGPILQRQLHHHVARPSSLCMVTGFGILPQSSLFFLAGGLSCMVSHAVAVPFDVIKTRQQTGDGSPVSLTQLIKNEGWGVLLQGLGPTLIGYAVQGSLKYGFYETFKPALLLAFHLEKSPAGAYPLIVLMLADPTFVTGGLVPCLSKIAKEEGGKALLFGLPAILAKQVPYTVVQLSCFEALSGALAAASFTDSRFIISVLAALGAAGLSSLASQPGDTLLSIVNKSARTKIAGDANAGAGVGASASSVTAWSIIQESVAELGVKGLFRGTKARLVHVGVIVVTQLLIYDGIKAALGLPIAGGH